MRTYHNGPHDRRNGPNESDHSLVRTAFAQWYQIRQNDLCQCQDTTGPNALHSWQSSKQIRLKYWAMFIRRVLTAATNEHGHALCRATQCATEGKNHKTKKQHGSTTKNIRKVTG